MILSDDLCIEELISIHFFHEIVRDDIIPYLLRKCKDMIVPSLLKFYYYFVLSDIFILLDMAALVLFFPIPFLSSSPLPFPLCARNLPFNTIPINQWNLLKNLNRYLQTQTKINFGSAMCKSVECKQISKFCNKN